MKYYCIGIKGAGVSAIASILKDLGHNVSGYDDTKEYIFTEDKLKAKGIKVFTEENDELTNETIVIKSSSVNDNHKEVVKARNMNLKILDLYEALGELTKKYETIAVCGCHGKTTTTSMMSLVLDKLIGVNYFIGDGTGYASDNNKKFVIESCEYKRHFLVYHPDTVVITNIDLDHVDYYPTLDDVKKSFNEFASIATKRVIACGDNVNTEDLKVNVPVLYYGINESNDIVAKNIITNETGMEFDCFIEKNLFGHFSLPFFGDHILQNVLAVLAVSYYEGLTSNEVQNILKTFKGADRRFNESILGTNVIIDDYGHHPKEVEVTIKAARKKYPNKKIVAIFQPHTYSRTQMFYKEIAESLNLADESYVLDIYYAREDQSKFPGVSSNLIIDLLNNGELISESTSSKLYNKENTVFLFMSPKEIYEIKENLIDNLKK